MGAVALTGCLREEKNVNAPAAGKTRQYGIIKAKKGGRRKVEWKGWKKSLLSRLTNVATGCLQPREINHLASPLVTHGMRRCGAQTRGDLSFSAMNAERRVAGGRRSVITPSAVVDGGLSPSPSRNLPPFRSNRKQF